MAMEDKNTPVQPDAVEATETRGRKVGAARFFELLGRDLWPFYKASILCVLGFAPGYAAVLFSTMAASLPLCLLSGAVGGLIAAPVFCGMLDTILRALRDEPGYWWHTYRMAWKQNWRESLLPGAGAGFCLGLWAFLLYALPDLENVPISVWICMVLGIFFLLVFCLYLFAQVVLVSVSQAERLKNAALFMIGFFAAHPGSRGSALHLLGRDACLDALHHPGGVDSGFLAALHPRFADHLSGTG